MVSDPFYTRPPVRCSEIQLIQIEWVGAAEPVDAQLPRAPTSPRAASLFCPLHPRMRSRSHL